MYTSKKIFIYSRRFRLC